MAALTHDAVVIGAGPAGALASLHLARQGRRVLVLEKARAGRDKPCGGGLTVRSWRDLEVPIDDLIVGRVGIADLRCGPGRSVRVPLGAKEVLMVRRRDLDRRIGESAEQAGAELHHCEPAVAIEPGDGAVEVRTGRGRYRAAARPPASPTPSAARASPRPSPAVASARGRPARSPTAVAPTSPATPPPSTRTCAPTCGACARPRDSSTPPRAPPCASSRHRRPRVVWSRVRRPKGCAEQR